MLRRFIVRTLLAAGTAIAVTAALATPALAKGATQASITGPGLVRPVTVSAQGEALPGQGDTLSSLAEQTGLFTVLFGPDGGTSAEPSPLRTPPAAASLGPKYTVTYTVPGVTSQAGQQAGRIRQDLYPRAADGPVIYTPPGQAGFGQPLQVTGWLRGSPGLTRTLARLGVPPRPAPQAARQSRLASGAHPAAAHPASSGTIDWLIASAAVIAAAITGAGLWRHRRKPATAREGRTQVL